MEKLRFVLARGGHALIKPFQEKSRGRKENFWIWLINDKSSEDMQLYGAEVVNMLRVTAWCLQNYFIRRPSMSVVVKVLEGVMHVEDNLDYNFSSPPALTEKTADVHNEGAAWAATPLLPLELSGPR